MWVCGSEKGYSDHDAGENINICLFMYCHPIITNKNDQQEI